MPIILEGGPPHEALGPRNREHKTVKIGDMQSFWP